MDAILQAFPYLLRGAGQTVLLSAAAIAGSFAVGTLIGTASVVVGGALSMLATAYVYAVRGIPVLVLIFLVYFWFPATGLGLSDYAIVIVALVAYGGALATEVVRGALVAVPPEQSRSARALGMLRWQVLRHVTYPQGMRYALPSLVNLAVHLIKCTSFVSVVGVWELTLAAREISERTLDPLPILMLVMIFYYSLCFPLALVARRLEVRS